VWGACLNSSSPDVCLDQESSTDLYADDEWVTRGGKKLIWLPPHHRHFWDSFNNTIVLGNSTGEVTILHLESSDISEALLREWSPAKGCCVTFQIDMYIISYYVVRRAPSLLSSSFPLPRYDVFRWMLFFLFVIESGWWHNMDSISSLPNHSSPPSKHLKQALLYDW
jgi:hypothetical protein